MYNFYIYKVTDKETRQFYIGSQCRVKTIGVNYFTSSRNKEFRNKFKANPTQFEIKIIGVFADANACVLQENIFIKDNIKNTLCLNKNYTIGKNVQFTMAGCYGEKNPYYGKKHSEETRRKLRESHLGKVPANKGKPMTEEQKKRMSETHKGKHLSEETKRKLSIINKGKFVSEETRKKISLINKGKTFSDEYRRKLSEAHKGKCKNSKKVKCIETNMIFNSLQAAADYIGYSSTTHISGCAMGKRKSAGGYHWRFV